jgi:ATP-dependent RNA helicase DDX5/DBP2
VIQTFEKVSDKEKVDKLLALLVDQFSQAHDMNQVPPLTIVFVENKATCDEVSDALVKQGLKATTLHGGQS